MVCSFIKRVSLLKMAQESHSRPQSYAALFELRLRSHRSDQTDGRRWVGECINRGFASNGMKPNK